MKCINCEETVRLHKYDGPVTWTKDGNPIRYANPETTMTCSSCNWVWDIRTKRRYKDEPRSFVMSEIINKNKKRGSK